MYDNKDRTDIKIEVAPKETDKDKLLSFGEYLKINLSQERRKVLGRNCYEAILEIHNDRRDEEDRVKSFRNQYYGIVAEKSTPYVGAFNLNVPITPKIVDAADAQAEEVFEDVNPKWRVGPNVRKDQMEDRDQQERLLDFYADTEMMDSEAWGKVYHDAFLLGTGWMGMPYRREFEPVKRYAVYENQEEFQEAYPNDYQKYPKILEKLKSESVKVIEEYNQEVRRSPTPEHYEWEDIYIPLKTRGLRGVNKAKIVARRIMRTWSEIYRMEKQGDFYAGVSSSIKWITTGKEATIDPEYLKKEYETFECIYFADIDGNNKEKRLLVNIIIPETTVNQNDESSRVTVAGVIRYPYFHNHSYIMPYHIRSDRPGIYQDGMGAMLQDIHIAANATLNHILDASVIANSLSLKAREGSDGARRVYEHRWYPGSVMELANMDDVQQFTFNTPNLTSLVTLFTIIERFAGDVTGIVNYLLGQESADDPEAPFKKTAALTRKAEIKLRKYIKNIKRTNNEMGYQALRLVYQFTPVDVLSKILGEPVNESKSFLKTPMRTVTQSSGFALDRLAAKQDTSLFLQQLAGEPEFINDGQRRVQGWYELAKVWGSGMDKKIELLLPTPDQVKAKEDAIKEEAQKKREGVGTQAAMKAKDAGASDDEAREIGSKSMRTYDEMLRRQQAEAQSGKKGKSK